MSKIIIWIILGLIALYILIFVVAILIQRKLVYPVPFDKNQDCQQDIAGEVVKRGDTTLYYQDNASEEVVVFYHGNADIVCDKVGLIDIFNEKGISYIFVEYPGYSDNGGNATHDSIKKSAQETIEFINEKGYKHVYVIGQSIGSGVASYHASIQQPDRLLLFAPFTNLTDVVIDMFPMYPVFLIEKFFDDGFDNEEALKQYKNKLLIVHGTKDTVVPNEQSERLYNNIPSSDKKYIKVEGYGHANVYDAMEFRKAVQEIVE